MFSTNRTQNCCVAVVRLSGKSDPPRGITFFVKNIPKNRLRRPLLEWIGGASVRKTTILSTIVFGCALAVSAHAARTESLSFTPQTVFQKQKDKAVSAPSKSEFVFKDRNGKTVSAPIVEQ